MSYKLLSNKAAHQHDVAQWESRNLEGELLAFSGRTLINSFKKHLGDRKVHALEGGCGLGAWCEWFERQGHTIEGIEYDQAIVEKAKKAKPDIAVNLGNITDLKFDDNSFDVYISLGVIEHFENGPQKALAEARRVLKPGGLGFFTVPLLTPMRRYFTHPIRSLYFLIRHIRGKDSFFWEYRYTRKELRNYLEDSGFTIIDEGIDDYERAETERHIGLWADWFFLRDANGAIFKLNKIGQLLLKLLKKLPDSWYCAGYLFVVEEKKADSI
jgi:ubiquinone/menaquinone biosynthesis C-methylase UbiE